MDIVKQKKQFRFSKYSKKCFYFISQFVSDKFILNLNKSKFLENLYKLCRNEESSIKKYTLISSKIEVRKKYEYPIIFYIFKKLAEKKLINNICHNFDYSNNIFKDEKTFSLWYKHNQHSLDINNIQQLIPELDNDTKFMAKSLFDNDDKTITPLHKMLYHNIFVPLDVQKYAENTDLKYVNIKLDDVDIKLYISADIDDKEIDNTINISKILHICNIMKTLSNKSDKINLILLHTKQKKYFDDDNQSFLGPININSGSTIRKKCIQIWRNEELHKVLIHELVHYLNIDYTDHTPGFDTIQKYCQHRINYSGINKSFEAYTEIIAVIINTMMCYVNIYDTQQLNYDLFRNLYLIELIFSTFQVAKIVNYYKANKIEDIFNKSTKLYHNTSVTSYFIIKCSLLYHLNDILAFLEPNINFDGRFDDFIKILEQSLQNQKYRQNVNSFIKYLNEWNSENQPKYFSDFIKYTLRMTCLELF